MSINVYLVYPVVKKYARLLNKLITVTPWEQIRQNVFVNKKQFCVRKWVSDSFKVFNNKSKS